MDGIENQIEKIKLKSTKNKIDEKLKNEGINILYQETLKIYEEYNKSLKQRVNDIFIDVFDEIAGRIYDSEKKERRIRR